MYPFERFSADAKQALTLAQAEAEGSHHSYIGTEHLLVGVLGVTDGLGVRVLAEIGVDLEAVRSRIATMRSDERTIIQQIIPTSRVKKVIELSFEEAHRSGAAEVTTGHMVLGLLLEGEGTAAQLLKERGTTVDDLRELLTMLTEVTDDAIGEPPRTIDSEVVRRIFAAAERDAAELGSRVVGSENLLRALISGTFTARIVERLGLDVADVGRVLTPPQEVQALSEKVQVVRAEKRKALAERDYPRAAIERRREKELMREVDERLRRWRETFE